MSDRTRWSLQDLQFVECQPVGIMTKSLSGHMSIRTTYIRAVSYLDDDQRGPGYRDVGGGPAAMGYCPRPIDDDRQLVGVVIQTAIAAHRGAATCTAPE
jgi:hypothetical protein